MISVAKECITFFLISLLSGVFFYPLNNSLWLDSHLLLLKSFILTDLIILSLFDEHFID